MLLQIHPQNPPLRKIAMAVSSIINGEVIITPTDSVYAFCCALNSKNGIQKICRLKGVEEKNHPFSLLVKDISQLSKYSKSIDNKLFKFLKENNENSITYILHADKSVSRKFSKGRKKIGVRLVSHPILKLILNEIDIPLISSSVKLKDDDILLYENDPISIHALYRSTIPLIIDGGIGSLDHSAIIDCTTTPYSLIREGSDRIDL